MSMLVNPFWSATGGGLDDVPLTISDLVFWGDALRETGFSDGDQMTTLTDRSGNGRHATGQAGGLNTIKPRWRATAGPGSTPAIQISDEATPTSGYFDWASGVLSSLGLTEVHGFAVVKIDQDPPDNQAEAGPPFSLGTNEDDYYPFQTDGKIYDCFASTVRKNAITKSLSLTTWHLYEVRSAANDWSLRFNGATSGGDFFQTFTNTVAIRANNCRIGSAPTNLKTLNGYIAKVLLYGRILNGTEVQTLYDWIEDESAGGLTLP